MEKIPQKIYLNLGFDKDEYDINKVDCNFNDIVDISWSDKKINNQDIEYYIGVDVATGSELGSTILKFDKLNSGERIIVMDNYCSNCGELKTECKCL